MPDGRTNRILEELVAATNRVAKAHERRNEILEAELAERKAAWEHQQAVDAARWAGIIGEVRDDPD